MGTITIRDKHLKLDQRKIDAVRHILGVKTETEAIDMALEMLIRQRSASVGMKKVVERILARRAGLELSAGEIAGWVEEGRKERDNILWPAK